MYSENVSEVESSSLESGSSSENGSENVGTSDSTSDDPTPEHNYSEWFSFYVEEIDSNVYARCCLDCKIVEYKMPNSDKVYPPKEFQEYLNTLKPVEVELHLHKNLSAIQGVAPTCTQDGYLYKIKCEDCGQIIYTEPVSALDHAWSAAVALGDCQFEKVCERCGEEKVYEQHDLEDVVLVKPTCTEEGKGAESCKNCDYTNEYPIPALGHDWAFLDYKLPTETEDGWVKYQCSRCGEEKEETFSKDKFVEWDSDEWASHDWETILKIEPTCTKTGLEIAKCKECGAVSIRKLPKAAHDWQEISYSAPTCTGKGVRDKECARCGVRETEELPALKHDIVVTYNEHVHIVECQRCGEEHEEELHELFLAMTTTKKELATTVEYTTTFSYECYGFKTLLTDNCGYGEEITSHTITLPKSDDRTIDDVEKDYETSESIAPTCTEEGLFILKLKSTGEEIARTSIPATGHWFDYDNICMRCGLEYYTEGLEYTLSDDETYYSVTGIGTVTDTDIVIPSKYKNLPVTTIGDYAFQGCSSLTSVTIGNGVTSIGDYAFQGCSSLTSVTIGNGVTSIGDYAFEYCWGLTSVTIGNGVTTIGDDAFGYCSGLTSVTIGNGVTSIGEGAFYYCYNLTSITVNENNKNYKSIDGNLYTKDGTTLIQYAVGKTATEFNIPDSVTSIGNYAFYYCRSLTSIVIPDSVTEIGRSAFKYCSSLTSVVIPDSVTEIGRSAFSGCSNLTSVTIGNGVTSIGQAAFSNCSSLTSITVNENNKSYKSIDGNLYAKDGETLIQYAIGKTATEFRIPDSVISIGEYAFYWCSSLTSIVIPDSVTTIGEYAFEGCRSLTSIVIPDSVTEIGRSAFYNCENLIKTENGVSYVDRWVIDCDTSVTFVELRADTKGIAYSAFSGCSSLTSVVIPDSVTSIGYEAFYCCSSLTSVDIGDGVTTIGLYAFYNCDNLTSVVIPDSVTTIGQAAFSGCRSLTSVDIGNGVTTIGEGAFFNCSSLTSITIGDGVTEIGYDAFYGCRSLTSVDIGDSVTEIGRSAFSRCSSLTSVTIGNGVTSIGDYAFYCCSSLTSVYYTGTSEEWLAIDIASYNEQLTNATRYYYSEGQPTEEGKYWHYVDGVPTAW